MKEDGRHRDNPMSAAIRTLAGRQHTLTTVNSGGHLAAYYSSPLNFELIHGRSNSTFVLIIRPLP